MPGTMRGLVRLETSWEQDHSQQRTSFLIIVLYTSYPARNELVPKLIENIVSVEELHEEQMLKLKQIFSAIVPLVILLF
jgi:hypothetical protein